MENDKIVENVVLKIRESVESVKYSDNTYLISCPLYKNDNTQFTIAVVVADENNYIFTDLGSTYKNMKDAFSNSIIENKAKKIMEKFNISIVDKELYIKTDKKELVFSYEMFVRALVLIDNII